jgi:hypothetical protein
LFSRSCMRLRCAGTRSSGRRCPAKGHWIWQRQEHIRDLVLFCSVLSRCNFCSCSDSLPGTPSFMLLFAL